MFRKVIRIRAADSPNVKSGQRLFPGVITKEEHDHRRATWDIVRQTWGLDAEYYEGAETLMFPPDWLMRAGERHEKLKASGVHRTGKAGGTDPGEGSADTSSAVVDGRGLLELSSVKTPITSIIRGLVLAMARKWGVPDDRWVFDAGGGGKQIADGMREDGYNVQAVSFGSAPRLQLKHGMTTLKEKKEVQEEKAAYLTLRDQMYWELRELLDPEGGDMAFAIPFEYVNGELGRQLKSVPLTYDKWGRVKLIPKRSDNKDEDTLEKRLGRSPDDMDALVLAVHGLLHKSRRAVAGVL